MGPLPRLLPFAAAAAACAVMLAGCTFLITFDDVPSALEGGADTSTPIGPPDVRVDGPGLQPDASADGPDVRDAIANPDACKGQVDGKYCGGDQIAWPGNKDDLVTCKGGVVANVKYCATGIGCVRMLNGYPDQCDECATKIDGTYCGRDMPGWDALNANFRVRCQNRAEVGLLLCNAPGCGSNGAASACK